MGLCLSSKQISSEWIWLSLCHYSEWCHSRQQHWPSGGTGAGEFVPNDGNVLMHVFTCNKVSQWRTMLDCKLNCKFAWETKNVSGGHWKVNRNYLKDKLEKLNALPYVCSHPFIWFHVRKSLCAFAAVGPAAGWWPADLHREHSQSFLHYFHPCTAADRCLQYMQHTRSHVCMYKRMYAHTYVLRFSAGVWKASRTKAIDRRLMNQGERTEEENSV